MPSSEMVEKIVQNRNRVVCVRGAATVTEASRRMRDHHIGSLVVTDDAGNIAGIFTERDVVGLVAGAKHLAAVKVADCISGQVITCSLTTPITDVLRLMSDNRVRHVPVVRDGKPIGMVSSRDLVAYELKAAKAVVHSQSLLLHELETSHPGITRLRVSASGRVVI